MGRVSRNESCPEDEINVVHCINRCVRRGFLCGDDPVTGANYEHRREWIRHRFEFLAEHMAVEVLGFAILVSYRWVAPVFHFEDNLVAQLIAAG